MKVYFINMPHWKDEKFESDGCSGGMSLLWRKIFRKLPPWEGCCFNHDLQYWYGGNSADRLRADQELHDCVARRGYPTIAKAMYAAVRIGGHPFSILPWRWGFGFRYTWMETMSYKKQQDIIYHD